METGLERDVDMVQETERQQVKDTKDRKHVQEHLDQVLMWSAAIIYAFTKERF